MSKILELLEKDSKLTTEQLAMMLNLSKKDIIEEIKKYEEEKIIVGYPTLINWERINVDKVNALIEVKVTPQREKGFDKVAERIYRYPEVVSCYLMSGGFDLTVFIEGMTMKEVAMFVAKKLAPMEWVTSTATHFVLKKYKDKGVVFDKKKKDDREAIVL